MFAEEEVVKSHSERGKQISLLVVGMMGLLFARLCYLQVFKGEILHQYSVKNRLREEVIWAPRGKIYSRNRELIVDNNPRFDIVVTRQYLQDRKETLTKLSEIIDVPYESISATLKKYQMEPKYKPIIVKKDVLFQDLAMVETLSDTLPGISVQISIARNYIDTEVGAHLLGYISEINNTQLPKYRKRDNVDYRLGDFIGQSGIEQQYDSVLRGVNGLEYVEVDALGRKRKYINTDNLFQGIEDIDSKPGNSMVLTIDRDLQKVAYDSLGDRSGGVVAIDVESGEILTYVSTPAFRPSEFNRGIDPEYWKSLINNIDRPLRDKVIQEHYSPGSTFKVVTAITALAEGVINGSTEVHCTGALRFGRRNYHCWKRGGHGYVNLTKAIRESCNVFFQKAALNLDIDQIAHYASLLGLGKKTGISLPRETSGLIPTKEWKQKSRGEEWQKGETLSCAIGQSYILTTPLQMAVAYAALSNGGKVFKPYLVKEIFDINNKTLKEFTPEVISELSLPEDIVKKIKKGLYEVVNRKGGTAYYLRDYGTKLAGKTGTSQVIRAKAKDVYQKCEDMPYEYRHHGVFAGFAPVDNPKIAIAAIVEHGCHGSTAAAPIVQKIATKFMKKYHPEEYEKKSDDEGNLL